MKTEYEKNIIEKGIIYLEKKIGIYEHVESISFGIKVGVFAAFLLVGVLLLFNNQLTPEDYPILRFGRFVLLVPLMFWAFRHFIKNREKEEAGQGLKLAGTICISSAVFVFLFELALNVLPFEVLNTNSSIVAMTSAPTFLVSFFSFYEVFIASMIAAFACLLYYSNTKKFNL